MTNSRIPAPTRLAIGCALLGVLLSLPGCGVLGDGDLKAQESAQAELERIAADYTKTLAKIGVQNDPVDGASKIDKLVREVDAIDGGSEQQKRTSSTLAAAMSASAGGLRAQVLGAMAVEQDMLREHIAENASAAMIVAAGAQPRATADFSGAHDQIARDRADADARRESVEREIAAMQQPLAQMRQQRERSTQQLGQLQADAAQLRQRANDAGPVDGYPLVEEAAGVHSRSIPVKTAIAEAEIQLSNLEPDIERLESTRENEQAIRAATDRAEQNTQLLYAAVVAAGEAGRERASAIIAELEQQISTYEARRTSEIDPLFNKAIGNLQKAQRGARGSAGTGAVIAANSARILGDLQAMRADAAGADAQLYGTLAQTGELTGTDQQKWSERAKSAADTRTTAIEDARAAYESALEKLGQGNNNQAARAAVQNLIAALDGTAIAPSEPLSLTPSRPTRDPAGRRPAPAGRAPGGLGALVGTKGFPTPEAYAQFLNKLRSTQLTPASMREMAAATYTQDPEVIASMNDPQANQQAMGMLTGGGANSPAAGMKLMVESDEGSRAELGISNAPPNMPKITVPLIKRDGAWFLDVDTFNQRMQALFEDAFNQGFSEPPSGGRGRGRGGR